jgi:NADH dehydrogenase [ubiquinone] 1 alpha subcomplex assembly factor 6
MSLTMNTKLFIPRSRQFICRPCLQKALLRTYASTSTPKATPEEITSATTYCTTLLRKYDNPSLVLTAFIPPAVRPAYLALRAFNISLSQVADIVSNPTVGALRMQFWRDTISSTFAGSPRKEPVSILLSHALDDLAARTDGKAKLNKAWFTRIIAAREKYMDNRPYATLAELESYAENTYSTLLYLTLSSLPMGSVTADHLASHIGKAAGIVAVLRGIPLLAFPGPPKDHSNREGLGGVLGGTRQGAVMLPLDVMVQAGVKEEEVFRRGAEAPGLRDAVFAVATRASDHLITARSMLEGLRKGQGVGHAFEYEGEDGHEYQGAPEKGKDIEEVDRAFGVFMPSIATSLWLERLQKADFDVFRPELRTSDWRLPIKAWWAFRRGKI